MEVFLNRWWFEKMYQGNEDKYTSYKQLYYGVVYGKEDARLWWCHEWALKMTQDLLFFRLWGSSELSMFCCNKEWPLQIYVDMFSIYLVLFISFKTIRAVNLSQILIWIQIHLNVDLNFDLEMNVDSYKDSGYLFILDLESDLYLDLVKIWIWILILEDLLTW